MSHKLTAIAVSTALALGSSAAFATANTTQMSSLLVFSRIDVSEGKSTLVNITNDSTRGVYVKCYYQNHILDAIPAIKNKVDFEFLVTRNQPVWFDARTGSGNVQVNVFPTEGEPVGSLTCWAVNSDGTKQISFNHLAGEAVIIEGANHPEGMAALSEHDDTNGFGVSTYNAWGFLANGNDGKPVGKGGEIQLGGDEYQACPKYLIGTFAPFLPTQLTVSSCTQDVRQDNVVHATKLKFDVWNGYETKFTGAWECMDSWHQAWLGPEEIDRAGQNFTYEVLGTEIATYRVNGIASSQCNAGTAPWYVQSEPVGLVGVQLTKLYGAGFVMDELHASGAKSGTILWDPAE
jgi:hypothetical protein